MNKSDHGSKDGEKGYSECIKKYKAQHELNISNAESENLNHLSKPFSHLSKPLTPQEALQEIQTRSDLSDKDYECLLMIADREKWKNKYYPYEPPLC